MSNYSNDTNIGEKNWELKIIFLTIQENQPLLICGHISIQPKVALLSLFGFLIYHPWLQTTLNRSLKSIFIFSVEMFLASEEMPKNGSQALKAILKRIFKDHFEQW